MPAPQPEFLSRFGRRCAGRRAQVSEHYQPPPAPAARREALAALRGEVHGIAGEAALLDLHELARTARALEAHLAALVDPADPVYRRAAAWCRRLAVAGERAGSGRDTAAEARALEAEITTVADRPPRRRILVFDDDQLIRSILVDALTAQGHTAAAAGDLLAFEASLAEFHPELILADMVMPEIAGDDVCRTLKTRFDTEGIAIVIMSGADDDTISSRARAAGADGWVSKARGPEAVTERLETLLGEILF